MRIDKYIWAVRLFKTRSLANKACDAEKVLLNGLSVKASKTVKQNDTVSVRVTPIWKIFKVINLPKARVGAKLVGDFTLDITPEEDLEVLKQHQLISSQNRNLGIKGRPTKKDRRNLGAFFE